MRARSSTSRNELNPYQSGRRPCFRVGYRREMITITLTPRQVVLLKLMFKKIDEEFDEMAADPTRRREGIARITLRRDVMCWCAVGMTLIALQFFFSNRSPAGGAAIGFAEITSD